MRSYSLVDVSNSLKSISYDTLVYASLLSRINYASAKRTYKYQSNIYYSLDSLKNLYCNKRKSLGNSFYPLLKYTRVGCACQVSIVKVQVLSSFSKKTGIVVKET